MPKTQPMVSRVDAMNTTLIETFTTALKGLITPIASSRFGLAFSGGVDSSLLAKVCASAGREVTLLTVGFGTSQDIQLSWAVQEALHLPLVDHLVSFNEMEEALSQVLRVIEWHRLPRLEICLGFYSVFKLASALQLPTVLSAHGSDELFCGYHAYRNVCEDKTAVSALMQELVKTAQADKVEVDKLAALCNIDYQCPFLSDSFIELAMRVPLDLKISHKDDSLRKHLLRAAAMYLGVPATTALRPKKAFQYSAGIHKAIKQLAKQRGFTRHKAQKAGFASAIEAYITHLSV